jgi:hypothetical protein
MPANLQHPLVLHMDFTEKSDFTDSYQRNNKAKGRKNLRCFPSCRHEGHIQAGYCGRPVVVRVSYGADQAHGMELLPCAEFVTEDEPSSVLVGQPTTLAEVIANKQSGKWFTGTNVGSINSNVCGMTVTTMMVAFNKDNQGWNYTWHSHRQKKDTKHLLRVFLLAVPSGMSDFNRSSLPGMDMMPCLPFGVTNFSQVPLPCVAAINSSAFSIYCRRKRPRAESALAAAGPVVVAWPAAGGGGAAVASPRDGNATHSEGGSGEEGGGGKEGKRAKKRPSPKANSSGRTALSAQHYMAGSALKTDASASGSSSPADPLAMLALAAGSPGSSGNKRNPQADIAAAMPGMPSTSQIGYYNMLLSSLMAVHQPGSPGSQVPITGVTAGAVSAPGAVPPMPASAPAALPGMMPMLSVEQMQQMVTDATNKTKQMMMEAANKAQAAVAVGSPAPAATAPSAAGELLPQEEKTSDSTSSSACPSPVTTEAESATASPNASSSTTPPTPTTTTHPTPTGGGDSSSSS